MQLAAAIYERHKGMMLKTALEHLQDPSLAQDVVHDTVLRMARYGETLRRLSEGAQARYAKETTRSVAINCERQLASERRRLENSLAEENEPAGLDTPEETYIEQDSKRRRLQALREALDELSEEDRALLLGKYVFGESDQALAETLGVKPASIRMKLTRARRQARHIMEGKEGGNGKEQTGLRESDGGVRGGGGQRDPRGGPGMAR